MPVKLPVALAAFITLSFSSLTWANGVDLGVQGKTYEIIEPDIRAVIMRQVSEIDTDALEQEMTDSAESYTERLPDYSLGVVKQTRTYYVNVEITVAKPIYRPVLEDDGSMSWEKMIEKGTKANPLDKIRPNNAYLVFNGESKPQVDFAKAMMKAAPDYIVPMMSAGDPAPMAKKMDTPVYRASPFILKQLDIENAPALARVGTGDNKHKIAVTEFAPPFGLDRALQHVTLRSISGHDLSQDKRHETYE